MLLIDQMKSVVLRHDPEEMVAWFADRSDAERSKLAKPTRTFANELSWDWRTNRATERRLKAEVAALGFEWKSLAKFDEEDAVFLVAMLATQPASELKRLSLDLEESERWNAAILRVLKDRKLAKIDEVVESLLASNRRDAGGTIQAEFLLRAIEEGVVKQPDSENYLRCLASMLDDRWHDSNEMKRQRDLMLRNDAFLHRDGYRLLQLDSDMFVDAEGRKWTDWICELSKVGKLDRDKVLQSVTRAMYADFKQNVMRGFVRLLEALQPTPEEMLGLSKDLSGLLGSRHSFIGKFAMTQIKAIHQDGRIDTATLLDLLPPIFACPAKGAPKSAITLIRKLAKSDDSLIPRCAETMMAALGSEAAEIQSAALDWLMGVKDRLHSDHLVAVSEAAETLAATNRAKVKLLTGQPPGDNPNPTTERGIGTAAQPSQPIQPTVRELRRITPIADHEALIDEIARTIEVVEDGNDAERVFEAMSRLGPIPESLADRAAPILAAVLAKRVLPESWASSGKRSLCEAPDATPRVRRALCFASGMKLPQPAKKSIGSMLGSAVGSIVGGQAPHQPPPSMRLCSYEPDPNNEYGWLPEGRLHYPWRSRILWQRMEVLENQLLEDVALPMLAAPTHEFGWIEPEVLIDRLAQWNQAERSPAEVDFLLSLMRLLPERRASALTRVGEVASGYQTVMQLALDDDPAMVQTLETDHLAWLNVAAHVRCNPIDAEQIARLGLDAGYVCGGLPLLTSWRISDASTGTPDVLAEFDPSDWIASHPVLSELHRVEPLDDAVSPWKVQTDAWCSPRALDPYWTSAMSLQLLRHGKTASNDQPYYAFLQALFDPHAVWSSAACGAVTLSLVGKDADASRVGIDVLVEAIPTGKPDVQIMVAAMQRVFVAPSIRVKYFAANYAEVAGASPLHRQFVCDTLGELIQFWCAPTPPLSDVHFNRLGKATDCTPVLELYAECLAELSQSPNEEQQQAFKLVNTKGKVATILKKLIC